MDTAHHRASAEPLRRRNGRPQACEPCRKRKVACDHAYPTCRRCKTRNTTGQCVYIISSASAPPRKPVSRGSPASPRLVTQVSSCVTRQSVETNSGYFGFTSFSTAIQETQSSLDLVQGTVTTPSNNSRVSVPADPGSVLSPRTLDKCLDVLRRMPDKETALLLFDKEINPNSGWIPLAARKAICALYAAFKEQLDSRHALSLQHMAHVISRNTEIPFIEDEADSERWVASFSGPNTRWECLGILFTYWFFAVNGGEPQGPNTPGNQDISSTPSQELMLGFKEATELCIELCKRSVPNSLLLLLLYNHAIIESIVSGDTSSQMWRYQGEVMALATFLGLHAETPSSSYIPTASSEGKRRIMAQIFKIDKVAASYCGRPPLMNRKYLLTPLPLDISDDVLFSDAETIKKAVSSLDEKGWNTDGEIYRTTLLRARVLLAHVKDEIMEMALGNAECTSVDDVLNLESREFDTVTAFPLPLHYSPDDIKNASVDKVTLYAKLFIHLDHLQNLFLIKRLLVQRGHGSSHMDLIRISFEMVSVTVVFWTHVDKLFGLQGNLDWFVMSYAAPAGGILCSELLMPTLHLSPILGVTRSGIIQRLSLLVGFLDWIGPSGPNGDICNSFKLVTEHVLDHSLNTPTDPSTDRIGANDFALDFSSSFNTYFSFELLDTFDWLRQDVNLN